ncbi:RNA-dependent RNA polymerase [Ceratobasidium sp. AG-Ba]|nr:RNA-dependent RNA polymerase [Ceratobasidium sp. AG-Ba]
MPVVYFSELPRNIARSAFRDMITKLLQSLPEVAVDETPEFTLHLDIPERPTAEYKHGGSGALEIPSEELMIVFMAKLKTEPMMFQSGRVVFSKEPPAPSAMVQRSDGPSQSRAESVQQAPRPASVAGSHTSSAISTGSRMNLNRTNYIRPPPERTGPKPENPRYERKLQHRLSVLGKRARLENFQFGVLRGGEFSAEYSQDVLDSGGDLSFKDDEKTLVILLGGTHQNPIMPSIAISIQTINSVALGTDYGKPYMFLELLQNPHFEREDTVRSTTGNAKDDVRRSRTRHSALDPAHRRVAPYTSRWLKLLFYSDGFYPDREVCELAGLPPVNMDPDLTFWLTAMGGCIPIPLIEKLAAESPTQACDALMSFRADMEGAWAAKKLIDFKHENIVPLFEKHIVESSKKASISRLREGSSVSNFMCHHVKITPTAVFLAGPLAEQSNRVIRRYPGYESNFIRVSFTDEAFKLRADTMHFWDTVNLVSATMHVSSAPISSLVTYWLHLS